MLDSLLSNDRDRFELIERKLTELIPSVDRIAPVPLGANRGLGFRLRYRPAPILQATAASDGLVLLLAFLVITHHPNPPSAVVIMEPENGVHPARLRTLVQRLAELTSDPHGADSSTDEPLTQLLLNSHSPVVLSTLRDAGHEGVRSQVVFADLVAVQQPHGPTGRRTRMRAVQAQTTARSGQELLFGEGQRSVSCFEVNQYLATVTTEME